MITIKLLGSDCTKSDYYLELVNNMASELQLDFTIEKVVDEAEIAAYAVTKGCSVNYCPGCNFLKAGRGNGMYTPALVVNGEVKIHSCFPLEERIKEALKK